MKKIIDMTLDELKNLRERYENKRNIICEEYRKIGKCYYDIN
jgi:hypothetical protein